MSELLVVNYPTISADDFAWIQDVRQQEDGLNFSAIDPHFTKAQGFKAPAFRRIVIKTEFKSPS